jgi:hypothetical protein
LFGALAISWRVHAGVGHVNHCLTGGVVTNGDKWRQTVSHRGYSWPKWCKILLANTGQFRPLSAVTR